MESDSLIIQSEQRLIRQAEELVLLVDSSKFLSRSSLVLCPLSVATTIITDDGIRDADRQMVENLGITLLIADREVAQESSSVA
jgi:DeoR family ulaG and ulaABCDEF operon transcriptional repressor